MDFRFASVADRFGVGTVVGAYLPNPIPESASPVTGAALDAKAVQSDGSLTFTGLPEGVNLVAYDSVSGRTRRFRTSQGAGSSMTFGAVTTLDLSGTAPTIRGQIAQDTAISFSGVSSGREVSVEVRQNEIGGKKVTWSGVTWVPAGPPALWMGANAVNLYKFISYDGVTVYGWAINPPSDRAQGLPYTHPEAIETFPVLVADNPRSLATGQAVGTFFIPDVDTPITTLASLCNGTPAAANTLAKMAIYEHTGNDNFVGRGRTASGHADATPLWSVAGTNEKPIADDGTGVSGSTPASGLVVRAGIEYVFFCLAIGGTMPQLGGRAPASGLGNIGVPISRWRSRRMCVAVGGLSDFPATFTAQSTVTGAVLWGAGRA